MIKILPFGNPHSSGEDRETGFQTMTIPSGQGWVRGTWTAGGPRHDTWPSLRGSERASQRRGRLRSAGLIRTHLVKRLYEERESKAHSWKLKRLRVADQPGDQWFSTRGVSPPPASPLGFISECLETFLIVTTGERYVCD